MLRTLCFLAAATATATAQFAPARGEFFWRVPNSDCMPDDEIGDCCPVIAGKKTNCTATVAMCKYECMKTANCGGFNLPNGHLKKLGCMDEIVPWRNDPTGVAPVDPGHHALTLYVLSLYPPRSEYWWELQGYDCNPDHELGNCTSASLKKKWEAGTITAIEKKEYMQKCKTECDGNIFCEAFNLPNGHLKAAGCKYGVFQKTKWGQNLFYKQDYPQLRNRSLTKFVKHLDADCNEGQELGNCSQYLRPPYTVSECESACKRNPLCGGFNLPLGHLKTVDCSQEVGNVYKGKPIKGLDLYLLEK